VRDQALGKLDLVDLQHVVDCGRRGNVSASMGAPSLWQEQDSWAGVPPLDEDVATDVAVVGGGVSGCACARRLALGGCSVVVLEAEQVASGASGRNGGFASSGTGLEFPDAAAAVGEAAATALHGATEEALDEMLELAAERGAVDAVQRTGSLWLAGPEEAARLAATVRALAAAGFECRGAPELVPEAMRRAYPAAAVFPRDCQLVPSRWVRALAGAALDAGARIFERTAVTAIEPASGGWLVRTQGATVRARAVVAALDGLLPRLVPEMRGIVYPVRGQMLATAPLKRPVLTMPTHSDHGFFYARPTGDGRIVIGGGRWADLEAEYTDRLDTTELVQRSIERYLERMGLGGVPVTHRWAGIMGFSADLLPVAGELPGRPGLYVAGGYSGVGNVQGFVCGGLVADMALGRPHALARPLSPARFAEDGVLRRPAELRELVESRELARRATPL
jgi:glycine/D-amino acid oxidase-like deaminating enzyme